MTHRISIVLVDDNASSRDDFASRIREQPGFRVLATSADVEEALEAIRQSRPDLVLLHLRQEGDDTLTLAGALHGEAPGSRVIIMGVLAPQRDVAGLLRAGASGFIMATASFEVFLETIHSVASGIQVLPAELTASLFGQLKRHSVQGRPRRPLDLGCLTVREREVADLLVQGWSNKEIGLRLRIALHTVKSHVHRVLSKLAVNNRLEVAAYSQRRQSGLEKHLPSEPAPHDLEAVPKM
jgi:DNA-binding NarL/FixJ family response regulator